MNKKLTVEVVSDHVCPWCYVGKKRLENAISQRPDLEIDVVWQPYQLSPDMPREGCNRREHYEQVFGEERAGQIMASMQDTGVDEGIAFGDSPKARSPNTLSAHALMVLAADDVQLQNKMAEKLFHAHHVDCEDIGDRAVLLRIAGELGMDAAEVTTALDSTGLEAKVGGLIEESKRRGVSGVPFFIINGQYGISGAQPVDSFVAAFDQISEAG